QMPSWRRWPRRRSSRTDRWRRPSSTSAWRSAEWYRYRMPGAPRRSCCWGPPGWCWPASAGTSRRWPRRRGSCRLMVEARDAAQPMRGAGEVGGEELRALALISLGTTEFWVAGEDPERHLEMGVALARQIGRPFLEFTGLAYQTAAGLYRSFTRAAERGR